MSDQPKKSTKKSAGKKSTSKEKKKQAVNNQRSSLVDYDQASIPSSDNSVSDAVPIDAPTSLAPADGATSTSKRAASKTPPKGDQDKTSKSDEKQHPTGTASTKKREAKASKKESSQSKGAEAEEQEKGRKGDVGAAGADGQTKKVGKKRAKKEEAKEAQDGDIDPGLYVRRSIRHLDRGKVNYIEPKVSLKEFEVDSSEEEEEDDESDQQQEETGQNEEGEVDHSGQKKKKAIKQKKEKVKKVKVRKFKKGKWNPDINIVTYDMFRNKPQSEIMGLDDSVAITDLNVIRAVYTDDLKLLQKIFFDQKSTSTLNPYWKMHIKEESALQLMAKLNRTKMIEFIMNPNLFEGLAWLQDQEKLKSEFYLKRAEQAVQFIDRIDTGMVSNSTYGVQVRPVELSRGRKEGYNAFSDYSFKVAHSDHLQKYATSDQFLNYIIQEPKVDVKTIITLNHLVPNFGEKFHDKIQQVVDQGNIKFLELIFESNIKGFRGQYSRDAISQEFLDIIRNPDKLTDQQLKDFTEKPIPHTAHYQFWHLSALDPTGKTLKRIIDLNRDKNTKHCKLLESPPQYRMKYFYQMYQLCPVLDMAALCETTKNLELLRSLKYWGFDKMPELKPKTNLCSSLRKAIMYDRPENVRFIVSIDPKKMLDRQIVEQSKSPLGLAVEYGSIESVKVLVQMGASVAKKHLQFREPPLLTAASLNQYEIIEYFIENKGRVDCKDMYGRTPLIMAVKAGHTRVASLILQRGADWNLGDNSLNTPLHYAAAFGWIDCLELLLKAGADINAENIWKITPIQIAMLKNRKQCIKRLLELDGVKVNCTDLTGRTLLSVTLFHINQITLELVEKIIDIGGDPKLADLQGNTPMHYLAFYFEQNYIKLKEQKDKDELNDRTYKIGKLLLDAGAEINAKNQDKLTVFAIAIRSRNIKLIEVINEKLSIDEDHDLLFNFCGALLLDNQYINIIKLIVEGQKPKKTSINYVNDAGFTPLLMIFKDFTENYRIAFSNLLLKLKSLIKTKGTDIANYSEFDNPLKLIEIYKDNSLGKFGNDELNKSEKEACHTIAHSLLDKHIVTPFVDLIDTMVKQGADPKVSVGPIRLKKDEGDKQKKKDDLRIQEAKKQYVKDYAWDFDQESTDEDELTEQDKKIRKKRLRIKKKVEEDEQSKYNRYGKKNAWHFAADMSSLYFNHKIFDLLIKLKVDFQAKDLDENTPIMLQVQKKQPTQIKQIRTDFLDMIIQAGADVNMVNNKGVSYFLQLVKLQDYENAYKLYEAGANPNLKSKDGDFALKNVFERNNLQLLIEFSTQMEQRAAKMKRPVLLNYYQQDDMDRNFLHFALNSSLSSIDASFKTIRYLLDKKVDYNTIDKEGRTPIHYAFCKIGESYSNFKTFDPIEIVSNMLAIEDLNLNIQDKWGKTPLHYACRHGSTMSAIYMLQQGADLTLKDIFGNKPLGIALLYNQWNLATVLIQKDGDMKQTVWLENYERQDRIWKRKEVQEKREQRAKDAKSKGGRRAAARNQRSSLIEYSSDENDIKEQEFETDEELELELEKHAKEDEKPLSGQSIFKLTVSRNQNALAYMTLSSYDNSKAIQDAIECKQFNLVYKILEKIPPSKKLNSVSNKDGQNLFQILFSNFDGTYFSEDKKLLDFITILSRRGVDINIKDTKGRQIMHHVCESQNIRLIKFLLKNFKFDINLRDKEQNTPFFLYFKKMQLKHQVHQLKYDELFSTMLKDYKADINALYPYGDIFRSISEHDPEEDQYVQRMIDIKEFPEKAVDPKKSQAKVSSYMCPIVYYYILREGNLGDQRYEAIKELVDRGSKFTVRDSEGRDAYMLAAIRNHFKILEYLFSLSEIAGKEGDAIDNKGWSALHYVVKPLLQGSYENEKMIKLLRDQKFKLDHMDDDGLTPADYAKQQQSQKLYKAFIKFKIIASDGLDKDKKSVIQEDEKMEDDNEGSQIGQKEASENKDDEEIEDEEKVKMDKKNRMKSLVLKANKYIPNCPIPFEKHADQFIKANQEKYKIKLSHGEEEFVRHELYEPWYLGKQFEIYKGKPYFELEPKKKAKKKKDEDEEMVDQEEEKRLRDAKIAKMKEQEYSVFLTKSNIEKNFGQYLFYKMQLLYDTNQKVHMVLTRWGQMGENGMHQRTPFQDLNKAKIEFHKIFLEKTGNDFENVNKFSRVDKKYNLTSQKTEAFNFKELLVNFDWEKVPKSKLDKKVRGLIRSFAHPGYYRLQMRDTIVNTNSLPISSIKPQTIQEAKKILVDLEKKIMKDHEYKTSGIMANFAGKLKVMEEIYELSNRYYELIPQRNYDEWQIAAPLETLDDIKEQFEELNKIDYISQMSKIYLGALSQQHKQNPLDYIHKIFNTEFNVLDKKTIEYKMLHEYISNTWKSKGNNIIANIFTVNKQGEEQALREYHDLSNQKLLFHGSSTENFVGIFYQGLQIQHSGTRTGQLLGPNALYFADRFDKAFNYARNSAYDDPNSANASRLVLICEVALGKINYLCSYHNVTMLDPSYSSVKLRGKEELDTYKEVRLESGLRVPQGQLTNIMQYMPHLAMYVYNNQSEYTVYRPDQVKIKYVVQIKKQRPPEKRKVDKETVMKKKIDENTRFMTQRQINNVIQTLKV